MYNEENYFKLLTGDTRFRFTDNCHTKDYFYYSSDEEINHELNKKHSSSYISILIEESTILFPEFELLVRDICALSIFIDYLQHNCCEIFNDFSNLTIKGAISVFKNFIISKNAYPNVYRYIYDTSTSVIQLTENQLCIYLKLINSISYGKKIFGTEEVDILEMSNNLEVIYNQNLHYFLTQPFITYEDFEESFDMFSEKDYIHEIQQI